MQQLGEATAAGCGAVVSSLALYPVNKVKMRLQAEKKQRKEDSSTFLSCAYEIAQTESPSRFFAGSTSLMTKSFIDNFIFYGIFAMLRKYVFGKTETMVRSMVHGITTGVCLQLIMSPIETALVQVMTHTGKEEPRGLASQMLHIFKTQGLEGFYTGIVPMLVLTLNPGINTMVRNSLTAGRRLSANQNFWVGAASKAVASFVTYPITLAKVQLQANKGCTCSPRLKGQATNNSSDEIRYRHTMLSALKEVIRVHGLLGLYRGCEVQVGQAIAKEAILNAMRIEIYRFVMGFFINSRGLVKG